MRIQALYVQIVYFLDTKVAVLEHRGLPHLEHNTARKLIEGGWKIVLHPD
jgi:DNA gyrase inhibitor GyrI